MTSPRSCALPVSAAGGPVESLPTLEAVMERDAPRLLALAYSLVRDRDQAAEVVQDSMERALRFRGSLRDHSRASAWLCTICVHEARRRMRRAGRARLVEWMHRDTTAPATVDRGHDVDLERALHRLSARQRAVVSLHYVYGYTLDESAAVLGCRPGTARRHLHRALRTLREEMER
jgi:RNA polymerase sigma-70 factor, ECF subfamily